MGIKVSIAHNVEKIKLFCAYLEQIPGKKKTISCLCDNAHSWYILSHLNIITIQVKYLSMWFKLKNYFWVNYKEKLQFYKRRMFTTINNYSHFSFMQQYPFNPLT
jgi:hypothetical protein